MLPSMAAPYRVGVVGYGWAASAHIPAIAGTGLAEVTAVASSRPLDADELARRHGRPVRVHTSFEALLADPEVDVLDLCSFPRHHAEQAIAAARAGKHLIVEKPLALNLADARWVAEEVQRAGVGFCLCFEVRFSAQFRAVRALLDAGLIGEVHLAEVDYYHGVGPWYGQFRWSAKRAEAGSSLLSAGCHALDALLLVMGPDAQPVEVTAYATSSKSPHFATCDFPTSQINLVRFADGRIGKSTSCLDALQPYTLRAHILGSHGAIDGNRFHSEKLDGLERSRWSQLSAGVVDSGDVKDHPYEAQFRAFFEALTRGETMPLTGIQAALATHELLFAADTSATEGRPIRLPLP
jgi:UDP-N-acetyl-2-amino-2-deoxyglucuronate dehydrogenase